MTQIIDRVLPDTVLEVAVESLRRLNEVGVDRDSSGDLATLFKVLATLLAAQSHAAEQRR